ncbi:MAG: hypothetical protein GY817_03170 [bacterium]|nr:hypothetical protein [bacterium]
MTLKRKWFIFFLGIFVFSLNSSLFAVAKPTIISTNIKSLAPGDTDVTLTFTTNQPLPQESNNPNLYSRVVIDSTAITVTKNLYGNNIVFSCIVKIAPNALPEKDIDVEIYSYDREGNETIFQGKGLLEIYEPLETSIEEVIVRTFDGRVKAGEAASVLIKGKNIDTGKVKVLLMWSGLRPYMVESKTGKELTFRMSAEDTAKLKPADYELYLYSGNGVKAETKITVMEADAKIEIGKSKDQAAVV